MSKIEVNIHKVNDLIPSFSKVATKISNTTDELASISSRLDYRVKSRRGINRRLHQITAELESMERKIQKLVSFLQESMDEYSSAEEQITKQVNQYVEKIGVGKKSKEKGIFDKILDGVQVGLDVVGLIPVVGEIADGVNGSIYLARGDKVNAALSFAAMIPVVGNAATGAKYVNKASNIVDAGKAANSAKDVGEEVISNSISKASPSELAQSWQGSFPYVGIDKYRDITLKKGKVIYVGEPYPTGYATTKSAVGRANGDARKLFEGLQVKPYWDDGMEAAEYRSKMMAYEITENIDVAFGITKANPQFGEGKLPQIFIHDFDNMIKSGKIKRLESDAIKLNNYKMPLDDYNKMLDSLEKLKK